MPHFTRFASLVLAGLGAACAPAPAPASAPVTSLAPVAAPAPAASDSGGAVVAPDAVEPKPMTSEPLEPDSAQSAGPGQAFPKGEALIALSRVSLEGCGKATAGHVKILFAPSGQVTTARIDDGPLVGTSGARCVEERFQAVRISPFGGAPVTVGKAFAPKR